jgi:hypothetical protein
MEMIRVTHEQESLNHLARLLCWSRTSCEAVLWRRTRLAVDLASATMGEDFSLTSGYIRIYARKLDLHLERCRSLG